MIVVVFVAACFVFVRGAILILKALKKRLVDESMCIVIAIDSNFRFSYSGFM